MVSERRRQRCRTAWRSWPTPARTKLPLQAGREQAAFPRAYSRNPERGISARDQDAFSLRADQTGEFLWFCGMPGHGQSAMWMRFAVTDENETPYITVTADAERLTSGACSAQLGLLPGRASPEEPPAWEGGRPTVSLPAICVWLTEGLDTADLISAKALLDEFA